MKEINNPEDFKKVVEQDKLVLFDFYADWCGPCQMITPVLDELSIKYENKVEIVKVNVDSNAELASHFSVRSIPSLFFFRDGEILENLQGFQPMAKLEARIEDLINPVTV